MNRFFNKAPTWLPVLLLVCLSTLGACMNQQTLRETASDYIPEAKLYVYECGDHYSFTARIERQKASLLLPSRAVTLPQASAASGAKYSDGQVTFWSKGEEALLEVDNKTYGDCKNNPDKAVWALTRARD
jgi:membrane-bound inhibitor of C-type lysozyme